MKVYLDDVKLSSKNIDELISFHEKIVSLFAYPGLKNKISKCVFASESVSLLLHIVRKQVVEVDLSNVDIILKTPQRRNRTEPRSFLGIAGCY